MSRRSSTIQTYTVITLIGVLGAAQPLDAAHHALWPQADRSVCVNQTEKGHCFPVWCDQPTVTAFWRGRIMRNLRGNRPSKAGQARAGSGCAVSDEHRFIYIHVLKSGGMSVKGTLKAALCDEGRFDDAAKECERDAGGGPRLSIQDCAQALEAHPDYTVFSFVRSPFSRWFSIYSMGVAYAKKNRKRQDSQFPLTFYDFVTNPPAMIQASRMSKAHWAAQTSFILDTKGCPIVDFVGALEQIDFDFGRVMQIMTGQPAQLATFLAANKGLKRAPATAYGERAKNGTGKYLNSNSIRAIQKQSGRDFELLGYATEPSSDSVAEDGYTFHHVFGTVLCVMSAFIMHSIVVLNKSPEAPNPAIPVVQR